MEEAQAYVGRVYEDVRGAHPRGEVRFGVDCSGETNVGLEASPSHLTLKRGSRGTITASPSADPKQAMLSVLSADQRATYEAERQRRREEASKDLESVGLSLPPDWDLLDDGDLR